MTATTLSRTRRRSKKPKKPREDFPLFAHANGQWAKKIRGKLEYFGPWDDPAAALNRFLDQRDDLLAGRIPRAHGDGLTVRDLCNHFLSAKRRAVESGELTDRSFSDYHRSCAYMIDAFGKSRLVDDLRPMDFANLREVLAKRYAYDRLGGTIQRVRSCFKYGFDAELMDRPARFGPEFKRPSKRAMRRARLQAPCRFFEAEQIRAMLKEATVPMKAMILLGVNCGLGNSDVADLLLSAVNLKEGVLDSPRAKTGIARRATLWPETVKAIRAVLKTRREPKSEEDAGLVFITKYGHRWLRVRGEVEKCGMIDSVGLEFDKVLNKLGMKQRGVRFYALRHTFRTVADAVPDRPAIDLIMGHENGADIAVHYRHAVSDERLKAVTDHVREFLFDKKRKRRGKRS